MKRILILAAMAGLAIPTPAEELKVDPSELWYTGYLLIQKAESMEEEGDLLGAINAFEEAAPIYKALSIKFPDFQPEIVKARLQLVFEKKFALKDELAGSTVAGKKRKLKEIEASIRLLEQQRTKLEEELKQLEEANETESEDSQKQGASPETFEDENSLVYDLIEPTPAIPSNWVEQEFEGETFYLIPLIETEETKAFSKLKTIPALLQPLQINGKSSFKPAR